MSELLHADLHLHLLLSSYLNSGFFADKAVT